MSKKSTWVLGLLVLIVVAVVAGLAASGRLPLLGGGGTEPGTVAERGYPPAAQPEIAEGYPEAVPAGEEGYPPPGQTPAAPLSPDSQGYLPVPDGVRYVTSTLGASPYADLLVPLQEELGARNAPALAARVSPDRPLRLFGVDELDSAAGEAVDGATIENMLTAFFEAGSEPLIQGYFAAADEAGLVTVHAILHPFSGEVPFPTPSDPNWGPPVPETLPEGAALWTFVGEPEGDWQWGNWVYGDYEALVRRYAEPDKEYTAVRP